MGEYPDFNTLSPDEQMLFAGFVTKVIPYLKFPEATKVRLQLQIENGSKEISIPGRLRIIDGTKYSKLEPHWGEELVIKYTSERIECFDFERQVVVDCAPSEFGIHLEILDQAGGPISSGAAVRKTLSLGSLLTELQNKLVVAYGYSVDDAVTVQLLCIEIGIYSSISNLDPVDLFHDNGVPDIDLLADGELELSHIAMISSCLFGEGGLAAKKFTPSFIELIERIVSFDFPNVSPALLGSIVSESMGDGSPSMWGRVALKENIDHLTSPLVLEPIRVRLEAAQVGGAGISTSIAVTPILKELCDYTFLDPTENPGSILCEVIGSLEGILHEFGGTQGNPRVSLDAKNFRAIVTSGPLAKLSRLVIWLALASYEYRHAGPLETSKLGQISRDVTVDVGSPLEENWANPGTAMPPRFILGVPQFTGVQRQSSEQKRLINTVFGSKVAVDFCAAWLLKASQLVATGESECAFILTNSVCQGSQVASIWPRIFENGVQISFAKLPFRWKNLTSQVTGVSVVALGLRSSNDNSRIKARNKPRIFHGYGSQDVDAIGPYLIPNTLQIMTRTRAHYSGVLPKMVKGNMPYDGGGLIFNYEEMQRVVREFPNAVAYFRRLVGAEELMSEMSRYCLWVPNKQVAAKVLEIAPLAERIENVSIWRAESEASKALKAEPFRFREINETKTQSIVIPSVSSESRRYIPVSVVGPETIVSNLALVIYDSPDWVFGLLSSKIHQIWARAFCGRLESRLRYSSDLCYHTFPTVEFGTKTKLEFQAIGRDILCERENHPGVALGDLYSEMPQGLAELHDTLDELVASEYHIKPSADDSEVLQKLLEVRFL